MATGANPAEASYTIETVAALPRVTAIRLEALPDHRCRKAARPGSVRHFQLNGFEGEALGASLAIKAIRADDSSGGASFDTFFPKALSRDVYAPRGWRIDASREETRLPRQIVFTLDRPVAAAAGLPLRIRLKYQGAAVGQALGRFRLSVTSTATPQRVVEIPARLRPILAIASAERTEQRARISQRFYRSVAVSLNPARDRIATLQKGSQGAWYSTAS